jgi:site-specific DNA recombinase
MKNVGLYVRVSTHEQAEKGWSIEGQIAELYKFCDAHSDWRVRWVLKDPGFTASNLDRPGMCRLLELAQVRRLDVLVVWRYDRLSRDNLDFPLVLSLLRKNGVDLVSVTEPALGTDDPTGEFVVHMIGLLATLERKQIAMRVKMGMRTRARNGLWHGGPTSFGYTYDRMTGKLVPDAPEAEIVRRIFETYATTGRIHEVKRILRDEGLRDRRGRVWTVPALRNVLSRRLYTGVLRCGGVEVTDEALALVTHDAFERCRGALEAERGRNADPEPRDGDAHVHVGKEGLPRCPRCESVQAVSRKRVLVRADGTTRRQYWCRACRATFDEGTARVEVPPCPDCGQREQVQYYRQWRSADGIAFRVFGCRRCGNRFRVLVRAEPLGGAAVRAVGASAGELEAAAAAPLPLGDA